MSELWFPKHLLEIWLVVRHQDKGHETMHSLCLIFKFNKTNSGDAFRLENEVLPFFGCCVCFADINLMIKITAVGYDVVMFT